MREIVRARHVLLEFNGRDVLNISELLSPKTKELGSSAPTAAARPPCSESFQEIWRLLLARLSTMEMVYDAFHNLQHYLPMGQYSF